jgi:1,2-diacylglycerol 3-alpha-glucosyltransferase
MEMTTGQFSDSFPPIMDGVALTVKNYLVELDKILGPTCAVVPACQGRGGLREAGVYRYLSVPLAARAPYRLGLPRLDPALHAALLRRPFDLVHAHSPFSAGKTALRLARRRGIPLVATFHSKYRDNLQQALRLPALVDWEIHRIVDFFSHADQVWIPTAECLPTLREYGYRGAVELVANGVDLEVPADRTGLLRKADSLFRTAPDETVLLYVGQLAWEKNLLFLVRALAALKARSHAFTMVFVGEGYAARKLETRVREEGLAGNIRFPGVVHDRDTLSACYARAELLLFPSLYDTCGLVVKEAAAFALPALLLRGSAAAAGVCDGVNGFLANHSVEAYAARLAALLARPGLLARAGEGARCSLYRTWRQVASEVKERYLDLAGRGIQRSRTAGRPNWMPKKGLAMMRTAAVLSRCQPGISTSSAAPASRPNPPPGE